MSNKAVTQGAILSALSKGAFVTVEYVNEPPSGAKKVYRLSSNNKTVRGATVKRMLADGLLKPAGDSLFFGETQTYVLGPEMTK